MMLFGCRSTDFNPSSWEAGGSLSLRPARPTEQVPRQLGLHREKPLLTMTGQLTIMLLFWLE